MSRELLVRNAARLEIEEAAEWYERRKPDLGAEFVDAVEATFDRVLRAPDAFAAIRAPEPYRRALVTRFPYHVFFETLADRIVIIAVAHERRRPGYWRGRPDDA